MTSLSEETIQIRVPQKIKRDIQIRAAEKGETIRTLILRALKAQGVEIDENELLDRRKKSTAK